MKMIFHPTLPEAGYQPAMQEMQGMYKAIPRDLAVEICPARKGYLVSYDHGRARLMCAGKPELFRALSMLDAAILAGKEHFFLEQTTPFTTRGVMVDCSRNSVPTVERIKEMLRQAALMGHSAMMLYTEETYEVPEYPCFGQYRGRYSREEIIAMDDYADMLGIELIPCIQTVSHLERALRWPCMEEVQDDPSTLLVGGEATERFVRTLLTTVSGMFRSRRVHLGLDEAHGLGLGRRLSMYPYETKSVLMAKHLKMVRGICDELGLSPMMWGDMLFRCHVPGGGYYQDDIDLPEEARSEVPEGFGMIYWDYYHIGKEFYRHYFAQHQKLGIRPLFATGVTAWLGMTPNLPKSREAIRDGIGVCREFDVDTAFVCVWRDDGGEGVPGAVLPGIQMFTEALWEENEERAEQLWNLACPAVCGAPGELLMEAGSLDEAKPDMHRMGMDPVNPQKYLLWQDPLLGQYDADSKDVGYRAFYAGKAAALANIPDNVSDGARDAIALAHALASFLEVKAEMGIQAKVLYDQKDRNGLRALAEEIETVALPRLNAMYELHSGLWAKYYKPFGWEIQDIRYGGMEKRLHALANKLKAYVAGEMDAILELDAPRLSAAGNLPDGQPHFSTCYSYQTIASVSGL